MTDTEAGRRPATGADDASPWINAHAAARDAGARSRVLLLCDYRPYEAATVINHIDAIRRWSRSAVHVLPIYGDIPDELDLEAFDGLIIHYNVVMTSSWHLSPLARWRIRQYTGVKAAFIQDEYRFIDDTVSVMRTLGIDVLFSCVPSDQVAKVYPRARLPKLRRTVNVLTGYVPEELLTAEIRPYEDRSIDVGYRGRHLPPWLGELAQEKAVIAERFQADAPSFGLDVDISCREEDRFYGPGWVDFISRCRAMLGVESGASVFDFDGSIERAVRAHLAARPDTPFAELRRLYFADAEGRVRLNQISPRCFEAAALGTLMVLYPGEYSGILRPWRHYVPLEKDHSNMAQVVEVIRDPARWAEITRRARDEIAHDPAYSFRGMAETVDGGMDLQPAGRPPIGASAFVRLAARSFSQMPHTRLHGSRLPPVVNRLRVAGARARRLLTPNAVQVAPTAAYDSETRQGLRTAIRRGRAIAWWGLRPGLLPWSQLARGGTGLLVDLGELRRLQEIGRRALATAGLSPYQLVLDREAGELRLVTRPDAEAGIRPLAALPRDLGWVRSIRLDLGDRWLAPMDHAERRQIPLEALDAVLRGRPRTGRRLLEGDGPWCGIVDAGGPT